MKAPKQRYKRRPTAPPRRYTDITFRHARSHHVGCPAETGRSVGGLARLPAGLSEFWAAPCGLRNTAPTPACCASGETRTPANPVINSALQQRAVTICAGHRGCTGVRVTLISPVPQQSVTTRVTTSGFTDGDVVVLRALRWPVPCSGAILRCPRRVVRSAPTFSCRRPNPFRSLRSVMDE
jgi:hypothetical protein